jgi:hypothetical protein
MKITEVQVGTYTIVTDQCIGSGDTIRLELDYNNLDNSKVEVIHKEGNEVELKYLNRVLRDAKRSLEYFTKMEDEGYNVKGEKKKYEDRISRFSQRMKEISNK